MKQPRWEAAGQLKTGGSGPVFSKHAWESGNVWGWTIEHMNYRYSHQRYVVRLLTIELWRLKALARVPWKDQLPWMYGQRTFVIDTRWGSKSMNQPMSNGGPGIRLQLCKNSINCTSLIIIQRLILLYNAAANLITWVAWLLFKDHFALLWRCKSHNMSCFGCYSKLICFIMSLQIS